MPPAVPTYDQAFQGLSSTYDPQTTEVNSEINQLPAQQQAQQSALDQAKVNAFQDITQSANSRGLLFSGFSPDQQATYVGTKYLPAVANLQTSFNTQKNTLQDKINQINAARATQAQGIVSDAQKEADTVTYNNQKLALSASKASSGAAKAPTQAQITSAIQQGLSSVVGKDGYVSPQDYAAGLKDWLQAGLSRATYNKQYNSYRNPNNPYYDYAVKQAGL